MNNITSVFEKINNSLKQEVTNFVYYDKQGDIKRITNTFENDATLECMEVPHHLVKDIINGKNKLGDYKASYDKSTKLFSVLHKTVKKLEVSQLVYLIPKVDIDDREHSVDELRNTNDIVIVQNLKRNSWQVYISNVIRANIKKYHNTGSEKLLCISITEENDPNMFINYLDLPTNIFCDEGSIEIPFKTLLEKENNGVSLFVEKYFDSYIHGVLMND